MAAPSATTSSGVEVGQGLATEKFRHGALHLRHAGGATHHDHALDLVLLQPGVAQGLACGLEGLGGQVGGKGFKLNRKSDDEAELSYSCTLKVLSVEAAEVA